MNTPDTHPDPHPWITRWSASAAAQRQPAPPAPLTPEQLRRLRFVRWLTLQGRLTEFPPSLTETTPGDAR